MEFLGDVDSVSGQRIWDGIAGRAVHGDDLTLALVELDPNVRLPEHMHANEQMGIVVEGSITFRVGGETRELGPGGTWRIPGDVPHSADVGPEGAVVVDVFSPARDDWKALATLEARSPRWPKPA